MNRDRKRLEAQWRKTQSEYDDSRFLAQVAGKLDFIRWELLEVRSLEALAGLRGRLLDAGAGTGKLYRLLPAKRLAYVALEPSPKMIAKAEALVLPRFVRGRSEELPFKDGSFAAVLIKETIDHCFDPPRVLLEAARVLAPRGRLVLTFHNAHAYYRLLFGWAKRDDGEHLHHFYPGQLKDMLTAAGFKVTSVRCHNYLRLPKAVENLAATLPGKRLMALLLRATDAMGKSLLPYWGGGVIIVAEKGGKEVRR